MSTRLVIHLGICISIFSSSLVIGTFLYIDIYVRSGTVKFTDFNLSHLESNNSTLFRHPYKRTLLLNASKIDSLNTCIDKYGSELIIKFNIGDTVAILVLMGTLATGVISLYTY